MNRLQKLFNIKPGENAPVLILFTYFFLFGAMITTGKTARNTYFLNRFDTSYLPLMFMGVAGAVTLTVVIYTRLSKRMGLIPLISVSGIFFALTLILLQFRLEGGFIPVLYVTIDVIVTVMSTQFWILAGGVFNSRQAKRLFGIILSASPIASIIIGAGIPPFVSQFGSGYLLILTAVFILCCVLMAQLAKPYFSQGITAQRPAEPQSKGRSFLDGYMKTIAVATGSAAIVIVIVEYQFLIISSRSFPSESELAGFFGLFYAITGVISLLIQVFLTGWILTKFGILPGMLVLPTGLSIGSVAILFSPLLASALIARTSDQVTKFTINKTSVELLWLPVAPERKQGGKLFIDGTIKTGLEGVVGVMIFASLKFLNTQDATLMPILSIVSLCAGALWIMTTFRLKKGYVSELMSALEKRRLNFEEGGYSRSLDTTDRDIILTIERILNSDNEAQQISALELIEDLSVTPWRQTLSRLFKEGSPFVQEKILSMAEESPEIISDAELLAIIDTQDGLATKALVIAGKRHMAEAIPAMTNCLEHPESRAPEIQAAAATGILLMDDGPQALAQSTLDKMLTDGPETSNIIALNMLVDVPQMLNDAKLSTFLRSDSIRIRDTALQVAEKRNSPVLIPAIASSLKSPQTASHARRVMKSYLKDEAVSVLTEMLVEPEIESSLKLELIRSLRDYPIRSAIDALIALLDHAQPQVYREVVDSLIGIARDEPLPDEILSRARAETQVVARNIYADFQILNLIGESRDAFLFTDFILHRIQDGISVLLKLSVLHAPQTPVENYITYIQSGEAGRIGNVLEVLDNLISTRDSTMITPLLEPISIQERCLAGRRHFDDLPENLDAELIGLIQSTDEWGSVVALGYVLCNKRLDLLKRVDWTCVLTSQAHKEMVTRQLSQDEGMLKNLSQFPSRRFQTKIEDPSMLSTLEKTIILKGVELFEAIPAEEVFHVAQITEERRLQAEDPLFHQGDPGDSLYIIVTGEILIHIGREELNRLGDGTVVGELAVLDGESRSASATAVDETILLKISQESFYEILDSRKEVMREIFKELTGRIRRLTDLYMQTS